MRGGSFGVGRPRAFPGATLGVAHAFLQKGVDLAGAPAVAREKTERLRQSFFFDSAHDGVGRLAEDMRHAVDGQQGARRQLPQLVIDSDVVRRARGDRPALPPSRPSPEILDYGEGGKPGSGSERAWRALPYPCRVNTSPFSSTPSGIPAWGRCAGPPDGCGTARCTPCTSAGRGASCRPWRSWAA